MTTSVPNNKLIQELKANPQKFFDEGKAYQLLEDFFDGLSLEALKPLLSNNNDLYIRKVAIWIAAELGKDVCSLIEDISKVSNTDDRYLQYYSLESTLICSIGPNERYFINIVKALHSEDPVIRVLAMRLLSEADYSQMESALNLLSDIPDSIEHQRGLSLLLLVNGSPDISTVKERQVEGAIIARKYNAIAAAKLFEQFPQLTYALQNSDDEDVAAFAEEIIDINSLE